jgi:hypothetical protein
MNKKYSIIFTIGLFFSVLGFVWLMFNLSKNPGEETPLEKKLRSNFPKSNPLPAAASPATMPAASAAPASQAPTPPSSEAQTPPTPPTPSKEEDKSTPPTGATAD